MRLRKAVLAVAMLVWSPSWSFGARSESASESPDDAAAQVNRLLLDDELGDESSRGDLLAPTVNDQVFLRRVWLDLVGQLPSPAEITRFCLDPRGDKRYRMVNRLLADERFGKNWSSYWRDVILYRRSEDRALITAQALQEFLSEQFNANAPWDEIASQFVTARGDVREDGRTALIMAQAASPEDTAAEISRIFLGIQIQCAQCHDHPTDDWQREQFHQLAAFFPRLAIRRNPSAMRRSFLVVADDSPPRFARRNNNNRRRGTLEHTMPDLDDPEAEGTIMQPALFATGQQLELGVSDQERRNSLAQWMTASDNPWFARAFVSRIWSELIGEGFYEPVDDMGPQRECSAPKTMEYLAREFAENGHDVKWLFRTIMLTEAYGRESRPPRKYNEPPFTANRAHRLRADQLFSVLLAALNVDEQSLLAHTVGPARRIGQGGPRAVFNLAFGYDPSEPRAEIAGSIPQTLLLMNSPSIQSAMSAHRADGLGGLLQQLDNDSQLVIELYLRCLAREPTNSELRKCLMHIKRTGHREEGFEDLLWALINSTEFLHRS